MAISVLAFTALLAAVGILRLCELGLSAHHQKRLLTMGIRRIPEPDFIWMVLVHAAVLLCSVLEVVLLKRPFIPMLAAFMISLFLAATIVRFWVIHTLKTLWTVRVMNSIQLRVVADGPFRFVRHPNYTAVFVELLALPLIHAAWITALVGGAAHIWVLLRRLAVEEPVLMKNRLYVEVMAHKPRFVPGLF